MGVMHDSDDLPRYVLTMRVMFQTHREAVCAAERMEETTGGAMATEYTIEEV